MVVQLGRTASAELIDFGQARLQRSISAKQYELTALATRVARLVEEIDTGAGDMPVIAPAPRPAAESRSLRLAAPREPGPQLLFQDFELALSQVQSRLDEIDSRINAVCEHEPSQRASAPQTPPTVLPPVENRFAQIAAPQTATARYLSDPITPPPLPPPAQSAAAATGEVKASPGALALSGAVALRAWSTHRLREALAGLWRMIRLLMSRWRASVAQMAAWLAACGRAKAMLRVTALPERRKSQRVSFARIARATLTLGLGAVGTMGGYHVLTDSKLAQMELATLSAEAARNSHGRVATAEEIKMLPPPPRPEIRVNSLETNFAPLDPAPISSVANAAFAGPAGKRPQTTRPTETTEPVSDAAPAARSGAAAAPAYANTEASPQDETESLASRAAQGDPEAQYKYATELHDRGDTKGAVAWLEKSAIQGSEQATLQLGLLYLKGAGVSRNLKLALKWLETAANNGDPVAMHNLGVLYSGNEGRKPDYARAAELFRRAAEQGVVDSQFNLALAYEDGLGVERDLTQAYAWFCIAAWRGDAKAAQKRREISKFLGREELAEAKTLAASLKLATQGN